MDLRQDWQLLFFKPITLVKQSTGKADICWPRHVTAAEWIMWNMQGADVSGVLLQDRCPGRTLQKTLKEAQQASLSSHEQDEKMPPG